MRRSIVSLIARRELRDLMRDRRTLFLILILPAVIYPVFALVGILFAMSMIEQKVVVGVVGIEHLPALKSHPEAILGGGLILAEYDRRLDDPPLIDNGRFLPQYLQSEVEFGAMIIKEIAAADTNSLDSREVDALLIIPADFKEKLEKGEKPTIKILGRDGDETSKVAVRRLGTIIGRWQHQYKEVRFARKGLPNDFDTTLEVVDPQESKPIVAKTVTELRDLLVKFFPFLLVMWTMAGALHPAIDLTAGEKERGTMETLLISPAERSEIVAGKFIAVWVFSYLSALWNAILMGGGAVILGFFLPFPVISLVGLGWAVLFTIPLAALFSGVAIALGVFARSTKEGQYFLMPLFLITMPLTLWSMTPGLKISHWISWVPLTGLSMLLQRLMSVAAEPVPITFYLGVIGSLLICVSLSLWWASTQFKSESVLFREAERFSLGGWLRSIFTRK
ncbi:MAG: ABC transporter permease [Planctomycetes bacterium]|nr:ABC transporter permease [Planctomycetota bacterium]